MLNVILYQQLSEGEILGIYLEGYVLKTTDDILIGDQSLRKHLKKFFDEICKTYWIGSLESQPQSYCLRYIVLDGVYADRICMSEWIGGARGYDWVIENNEDIFDLLSDYNGRYIAFAI